MGPPIPHGESTGVTIYEGEERREDRAGDWMKVPFEAQRKVVGRRLDQSWKIPVDVSTTVPPNRGNWNTLQTTLSCSVVERALDFQPNLGLSSGCASYQL